MCELPIKFFIKSSLLFFKKAIQAHTYNNVERFEPLFLFNTPNMGIFEITFIL
ncbi:hypothetical protein HZS_5248 [Henneguya salminicola]|nr:hypothetical protein HZS_5248 [Henneguya salminicola]